MVFDTEAFACIIFGSVLISAVLASWWISPPPQAYDKIEQDVLRKLGIDNILHDHVKDLSKRLELEQFQHRCLCHDYKQQHQEFLRLDKKCFELQRQLQEYRTQDTNADTAGKQS